jgi:radical SAM superfamily enzyme YgiQ (UPF0313 family)
MLEGLIMKISLVNPPPVKGKKYIREGRCMQSIDSWAAIWPPLTLAILATIAREYGEVDLFDCNVEDDYDVAKTVQRVQVFNPEVVVVNTSFPSIEGDEGCAEAIKNASPSVLIVGFGVFFTLLDERALQACPAFDVGISGEPEITFKDILEKVANQDVVATLPGLMWREGKAIVCGKRRPFIENLDKLPFAARDLLRNNRYILPHNGHPFTLINVARGCPYPCTYCISPVYYGKKVRRHSHEYILDEMEYCKKEHKIFDFLFWEEIFTLDRDFGIGLCEAIGRKGWNVSWATTTRADCVDKEILITMKKNGCSLLGLGIETTHQHILDNANKNESVDDIRRAVELCKEVGLKTMGHFIFGLPGETPETAHETIMSAREFGLDYMQCYAAVPYPKTSLGEMAREKGWITSEKWADYDFGGRSILDTGTISPEEVDRARTNMFRKFYFRLGYILKQLGMLITHPRQMVQASKFLKWMKS